MRRLINLVLVSVILLFVMSCGGGGGGDEPSTPLLPPPPAPHALSKVAGDGQTAAPGAVVAVAPEVVVVDSAGAPVTDTEVAFVVTAGGGSLQFTSARTDAAGRASCGAWTLGSAKGLNTLSASVAGLVAVTFSAKAANTSADVSVSVQTPSPGQTVGEAMTVAATVTSTYQLAAVTASANGRSVQLTYGPYGRFGSAWSGVLPLVGQPRGGVDFVVTATDVFGHLTDVIGSVVLDRRPAVTVSAPADGIVARPKTDIVAACADDDAAGCASLTATVNGTAVATGKVSISQLVDFAPYEGQSVSLDITGVDSIGQRTTVTRNIFVESSAHLAVRAEVSGPVWDVSGARILFLDATGTTPALKVLDTAAGTTQTVETSADLAGTWGGYGFLTATGALYVHGQVNGAYPYAWLYEWRAGKVTNLGGLNSAQSLRVAGNWAIYDEGGNLWRRDVGTGVSTLLTDSAGNWMNDVAPNGDVVYWTADTGALGYNIYRWRNGTAQALTNDPYATLLNTYPVTDGVNVVYRKHTPCCAAQTYRIAVHDGSLETVLTAATTTDPDPGRSYAAAGGYVAYAAEDIAKASQIWRHGPGGEQQLTFFGSSSTIDAIGADGTVLLTQKQKRYRAAPGTALQEIGSSLGRVIFRDGKFLVLLDRTVLEVGS